MSRHNEYHFLRSTAMSINWLSAVLLLVSYLAEKDAPSQQTVIAVFGLVYPVLLFANLFFVIFWLLRKDARLLLSLLIILMGFPHLKTNFSFHLGQENTKEQGIKILSYNVQGFSKQNGAAYKEEIKTGILSFLLKENPEYICLQEYSGRKTDLFRQNESGNAYFHGYYTQKGSKNTGLVIVTRNRIFQSNFLKFKGYRTFGIYADIATGKDTLRLINVHLASISLKQDDLDLLSMPPSPAWEKQNVRNHFLDIYHKLQKAFRLRERQLNLVIKTIQSSPWPVILCGDFNDTPSSYAYHRVAVLLQDAFVKNGYGLSSTYAGPLPFLRIDYLFAGKQFKITSYKKHNLRLSDHYPVSMEVIFMKN